MSLKDIAPLIVNWSPAWATFAICAAIFVWRLPQTLTAFLTHWRIMQETRSEEKRKEIRFDLEIREKLKKIEQRENRVKR
jgi:hypothetical protein